MGTFRIATGVAVVNPVRRQTWNANISAGDDLKIALSIHGEDGALVATRSARSRILLIPDVPRPYFDYEHVRVAPVWGELPVSGYAAFGHPGQMNFQISPEQTHALDRGRYRLSMQVDLLDGTHTQVEGILQVANGDRWHDSVNHGTSYFQLDRSPLDGDEPLADVLADNGIPIDADGFYLLGGSGVIPGSARPDYEYWSSILGTGPTKYMILADDAGDSFILGSGETKHTTLAPELTDSSILGISTLTHMILAADPVVDFGPTEGLLGVDGAFLLGTDGAVLLPPP